VAHAWASLLRELWTDRLKDKERDAAYEEFDEAPYYEDEEADEGTKGKKKGKAKEPKASKRHVVRKWVSLFPPSSIPTSQ
jgi:hypothetical protein